MEETVSTRRSPDAVDVEIGRRIKTRRLRMGLSQSALGAQVGVTFQQIQKYETGRNRVAGGRLTRIAAALGTTVHALTAEPGAEGNGQPSDYDLFQRADAIRLVRRFNLLPEMVRSGILGLVESIPPANEPSVKRKCA